jgi:hypothetical protein
MPINAGNYAIHYKAVLGMCTGTLRYLCSSPEGDVERKWRVATRHVDRPDVDPATRITSYKKTFEAYSFKYSQPVHTVDKNDKNKFKTKIRHCTES